MTDYQIVMTRAPDISDAECRRRLHQAYTILLDAARKKTTADRGSLAGQTRTAAGDVTTQEADTHREDTRL